MPHSSFAIKLYPNPTDGKVTVMFGDVQKEATVVVYTSVGQEVIRQVISSEKNTTIHWDGEPGVYHVVVTDAQGAQSVHRVLKY